MTAGNLQAVAINATTDAVLVVGMMILMIAGVFDLSIGSTLGLSGVASAMFVVNLHQSTAVAILAGLAVGAACGLVNGLIVVKIRINALIATLATLGIFEGITQLLSGNGVDQISNSYAAVGQNTFLGLQLPVWIALIIVGAAAFAVGRTTYFRRFYFIGGNQKAARLSGIRVDRLVLTAFVLMGILARLNAAVVSAGTGEELTVITAAVLGGASLAGGEGKIFGGVLGVIFLSLVTNCLIIIGVTVFWQNIVVGLVLLVAVSLDRWKRASRL
jgi:ribose/xylose/arabinose/galactoside ABC-type transport system permease subunit